MTINWISSNENGYKLRVPKLACSQNNSLYKFINPIDESLKGRSIDDYIEYIRDHGNNDQTIGEAQHFLSDRHFVYKDIAEERSKESDDYDGVCKSNTYSGNRPDEVDQDAPSDRIRKIGDNCELMRQNMWS